MSRVRQMGGAALAMTAVLSVAIAAAALWWVFSKAGTPVHLTASAAGALTAPATDAATIERGAYLARLGHCAGCHTAAGNAAYAGGRGIATPFGTVFGGNLTPDAATGLGQWTADDFWRALHHGRSRDGRALIPAFPYTEFTRMTRADSDALWAYLQSIPAVVQANRAHELRFPYNTDFALAVWRAVYFQPGEFKPDPTQSLAWNRGAYLAQALGHCATCHAPRDRWGGSSDAMTGGRMPGQGWWAPSLVDGALSAQHMVVLLKTGQSSVGTAFGPMAEVVVQSTQHWRDADLAALALYFDSQAPSRSGSTAAAASQIVSKRGRQIYADHCAGCHGAAGQGVPGIYPPLAGNPSVQEPDVVNLVKAIRQGGFAPATAAHPRPFGMPPYDMTDKEVADVLTYLRQSWGHTASAVSELEVLQAH